MNPDDIEFLRRLKELLDDGVLTQSEFEERKKAFLGLPAGQSEDDHRPTDVDRSPRTEKFITTIGYRYGSTPDDIPDPSQNEQVTLSVKDEVNDKPTGISKSDLYARFSREDAEDLVTLKRLADAGLVDASEWERIRGNILRDRVPHTPLFKKKQDRRRNHIDVSSAIRWSTALQFTGIVLGALGVLVGLIVAFQTKVDQNCSPSPFDGSWSCYDGDTSHPFLGLGLGLIANSLVFGLMLSALGLYMEARLRQAKEMLER